VARLRGLGQPACAAPLLVIEPVDAFAAALQTAWRDLAACRLVMFVSPNAVLQFFAQRPSAAAWPAATLAAATGPGTVAALRAQGIEPACVLAPDPDATQFDAETLWRQRLADRPWAGQPVLIVRGEDGRDWLADTLRAHGAPVRLLAAYRRAAPAWSGDLLERLRQAHACPAEHAWLFSSSQAIAHLHAFMRGSPEPWAALRDVPALATHPRIAQTAIKLGWTQVLPSSPDPASVVRAMLTLAPA
jgi:uroporphyrinogen-III synthase